MAPIPFTKYKQKPLQIEQVKIITKWHLIQSLRDLVTNEK